MILSCNYEELRALETGAELIVGTAIGRVNGVIAAPPEAVARVESLMPLLVGDISIESLAEQREIREAVAVVCDNLRERLEDRVVEYHPAHEEAVTYYFDFAHVRSVLHRLDAMGREMTDLIELMTGAPANAETARSIAFPD